MYLTGDLDFIFRLTNATIIGMKSHIGRLFEDIGHGLTQLLGVKKRKDSITFIGTLIVIKDTQPQTIAPNIAWIGPPGQRQDLYQSLMVNNDLLPFC